MTALSEDAQFAERYGAYQTASKGESITLKPGDTIPLKRTADLPPVTLLCVASNAALIDGKTKTNPECGPAIEKTTDTTENGRSIGLWLKWGEFDFVNLADLTPSLSSALVCPSNQIGEVDLYQATHHGGNLANTPILMRSLSPGVAVMINGPRKGGHVDTIKLLRESPAIKAVYQLHRNVEATTQQNLPAELIANLNAEEEPDAAKRSQLKLTARRTFKVANTRTKGTRPTESNK